MSAKLSTQEKFTSEEDHCTFARTGLASIVIRPACGKGVSINRGEAGLLEVGYPMDPCNYSVGKILLAIYISYWYTGEMPFQTTNIL